MPLLLLLAHASAYMPMLGVASRQRSVLTLCIPYGKQGERVPEFRREWGATRIFVENLSFSTDWQSLKEHFKGAGYPTVFATVSTDRRTGRSKGCTCCP